MSPINERLDFLMYNADRISQDLSNLIKSCDVEHHLSILFSPWVLKLDKFTMDCNLVCKALLDIYESNEYEKYKIFIELAYNNGLNELFDNVNVYEEIIKPDILYIIERRNNPYHF